MACFSEISKAFLTVISIFTFVSASPFGKGQNPNQIGKTYYWSHIFPIVRDTFLPLASNPLNGTTLKNCGRSPISPQSDADRIVGGEYAHPAQFPWMVSLQEEDEYGFEHACGAAILNEYWIITAAHCIEFDSPSMYEILAGTHKLSEPDPHTVKRYAISKIVIHPLYDDDSLHNDIALLRTAKPIDFGSSQGSINGICLPNSQKDPTGFATVAGWGHEIEDGENTDLLKYVLVPIIPREMCNEAYDENPYDEIDEILDTMICAGMTGRDSCQNDSGGPLIQTDAEGVSTLIGIVSNGAGCGLKFYPGIYTKVAMFQDWMTSVMAA